MDKRKIVVVGGGTGNHTSRSGLKYEDCDLTAVVAMTDSGGSSGRGDIRQCLVALAPDDRSSALMARLLDYRFNAGSGLNGHSFGNLFLTALTEITGNTATAIEEASRMLSIRGTVLPVTLSKSTLVARLKDGSSVVGEANIDQRNENLDVPIDYVYLEPKAYAYPPVLEAIETADAIIMGPGDIYTSILPNLLVEDVSEAIKSSNALKICLCNLMTKRGESDGFNASDFVNLIREYLGTTSPLDYLVVNSAPYPERLLQRYSSSGQYPVDVDLSECSKILKNVVREPLLSAGVYLRHDPHAL
ncbi:MAG: YvcK family protein, partial [Dehalococcoidia bacterium]|nr:YvcK family protein [Dehalococcoidia bacterium]